jgi:hypothetical protein
MKEQRRPVWHRFCSTVLRVASSPESFMSSLGERGVNTFAVGRAGPYPACCPQALQIQQASSGRQQKNWDATVCCSRAPGERTSAFCYDHTTKPRHIGLRCSLVDPRVLRRRVPTFTCERIPPLFSRSGHESERQRSDIYRPSAIIRALAYEMTFVEGTSGGAIDV